MRIGPLIGAVALIVFALPAVAGGPTKFQQALAEAAAEQTHEHVVYDGSYRVIAYPGGDVPRDRGACTDVVVRAYRALGVDLQVLVHEDMVAHFADYPHRWGLAGPDTNIDHRRVPNLAAFFQRRGTAIAVTRNAADYLPGDVVTWDVGFRLLGIGWGGPHIGIVATGVSRDAKRHLIVHNIGWGPKVEDVLFDYPITGHYRFQPTGGAS